MQIPSRALVWCLALLATSLGADWRDDVRVIEERVAELASGETTAGDAERFAALVEMGYDWFILNLPEFATQLGDPRGNDRWTDQSLGAITRRHAVQKNMLAALEGIDRTALDATQRTNYDMYLQCVRDRVEEQAFPGHLMPLNQMRGVQQDVAQLMAITRPRDTADYEAMLARLDRAPELIDQNIALMRAGLASGITPPAVTLRDVPQQVRNQLVDDPAESPVLGAFRQIPDSVDELQRAALVERAHALYSDRIVPAYERLLRFLEEEYIPAARTSIGLRDLPDGEAWYAHNVRRLTTTDLRPEEIHVIGLNEVTRIRAAMDAVIESTGFEGDFEAFLHFLRTDPRFYHTTAEGLLREYRDIAKRADPELMKLFGHLPRTPYGVIPVPAYAEKSQTTAYYQRGSLKAGRPGYFFANTYALETRPRWEMEALTLHEAVPGHHLQIAIQDELQDLPWFRRFGSITAFTEGWGLYAESLGEEMGFYRDPYSRFGQLTYEMWRAIRLVVDTGMHQLGWSREQAIEYFKANAGKQEHDIVVEIDRYIVWPGQALAYKLGELKIKELRAWAADQLGEAFDIREFHDALLGQGSVPLDILDANIRAWVAARRQAG